MTFGKKGESMEKLNSHPEQKQWSNSLDQANPCKSKQRSLDKKMHPHLGPRRPRAAGRPKGQRPKQSWTKTSPRCGETEWEKIASRAFGLEQSGFNFGFGGGLPSPLFTTPLFFHSSFASGFYFWNLQPGHSLRPEPCRGMSSTPGGRKLVPQLPQPSETTFRNDWHIVDQYYPLII